MAKARFRNRWLAGLLLTGSAASAAGAAPPTAAEVLQFRPRQPGVTITTPTESQKAACKVELIKGPKNAAGKTPSGWVLKDPSGKILRRFFDTDGDGRIDVWSYYLDGQEVYREIDSNFNEKPDQFRWLGSAGSKWGVDFNEDGKIDTWKVISVEELSQEVLQAVIQKDFARFQALMLTKADLELFDLPESEIGKLREQAAAAQAKFQKTIATLSALNDKTTWLHLETPAPSCIPADALGAKADVIKYKYGSILYEHAGKADWLQMGEILQVGRAWRMIEGPTAGARVETQLVGNEPSDKNGFTISPELKPLIDELRSVDESAGQAASAADAFKYNLARAGVIEKIIAKSKPEERENWVRQLADALSAAAQNAPPGDKTAYSRLLTWKEHLTKTAPGSQIAGYVLFREMSADYSLQLALAKSDELIKLQDAWRDRLKKFIEDYPATEDTPEAIMQLAMIHEFAGKETDAKNWYGHLVKHFEKHPLSAKANGSLKRLNSEGKDFELAGPQLDGTPFDIAKLKGKVVIVYYWASWNQQCLSDFNKLKALLSNYGNKGVDLVTINLDNTAEEAVQFLQRHTIPGTHLHQAGSLESPLAVQYGVMVLPHAFVIGKEGKVLNRSAQIVTLEEELKKLLP